jgi:hypothetical protein
MEPHLDSQTLAYLTAEQREEVLRLISVQRELWTPLDGPQTMAYESEADITGYGGAAGGGKSDFGIGLGLTRHLRVGIFRETGTELTAIVDRIAEILGTRQGHNGTTGIWRLHRPDGTPVQIELGSYPNPRDETKYQGRPHDLLVFDEAQNHREQAVRFLLGWLRTTVPEQRCRAVLTFNPPTTVEGRWVTQFFAPWLDRAHPRPAEPGELRWFASVDGHDHELDSGEPFERDGELIMPLSRTFIPSKVSDNPFLARSNYVAQLQSLPEPLRSQMLHGDFHAGVEDDPWQVIRTEWVEAAQRRWKKPYVLPEMDSMGVDVAMGGRDDTVIARRHGSWFDEPIVHPGKECVDGPTVAGLVLAATRNQAVIHIDLFGVGAKPFGYLMQLQQQVIGVNVGDPCVGTDTSGRLRFKNLRSMLWWKMREALEPTSNRGICLPPDKRLLADLTAVKWKAVGPMIQVESSEDVAAKLGRSMDFGAAYVLGLMDTPKRSMFEATGMDRRDYNPYEHIHGKPKRKADYNPYGDLRR